MAIRITVRLLLLVFLASSALIPTACESEHPASHTEYIRGEVVEVTEAAETNTGGAICYLGIEGARSSPTDEAIVAVTSRTRILDRRGEEEKEVGVDSIRPRQTVEVTFIIPNRPDRPFEASQITICP